MVIDDDKAIRNSFMLTFEGTECETDTAENGTKGLQRIKEKSYDLVFLDLKMPGMDGVQVLKEIKRINRNLPVYIITAFHKEYFNELQKVLKDGYEFEILQKPLNSEQLQNTVDNILKQL